MSETEVYKGPELTPARTQAELADRGKFIAQAFPQLEAVAKKGKNNLDPESQQSLDELRAQMRVSPPKPATVINLHPWPLSFGYTDRILRGITVPACHPGMPFAHFHIRGYRIDWKYSEGGSQMFMSIPPIRLAGEFIREFAAEYQANGGVACGGGVIIYEGEGHPDKVTEVETYGPTGRLITQDVDGFEYDPEGFKVPTVMKTPITAKLQDLLKINREMRNKIYRQRVEAADHDYKLPDGKGRRLVTDKHRLMAEVLHAEGIIPVVPEWNLASRMELGLSEDNCPSCGAMTKKNAFKCPTCSYVLNALEAYRSADITYDNAMALGTMTIDEMEEATEIKAERDEKMAEFKKRMEEKKKAVEAKPKK